MVSVEIELILIFLNSKNVFNQFAQRFCLHSMNACKRFHHFPFMRISFISGNIFENCSQSQSSQVILLWPRFFHRQPILILKKITLWNIFELKWPLLNINGRTVEHSTTAMHTFAFLFSLQTGTALSTSCNFHMNFSLSNGTTGRSLVTIFDDSQNKGQSRACVLLCILYFPAQQLL